MGTDVARRFARKLEVFAASLEDDERSLFDVVVGSVEDTEQVLSDWKASIDEMQELNTSFNMQYLQLQEKIQKDSRQFTLISNIMKTKRDTAKNAVNNVR